MKLSDAELERVERMLEEGRVRCEPPVLSETDAMMALLAPATAPLGAASAPRQGEACAENVQDTGVMNDAGPREPFSLAELIEQRKKLLSGDGPLPRG